MSDNLLLQLKAPQLIVVTAFDRDETGDLQRVFGPAEAADRGSSDTDCEGTGGRHYVVARC